MIFKSNNQKIAKLKKLSLSTLSEVLAKNRAESQLEEIFGKLPEEATQSQFTGLSQEATFLQALTFIDLYFTDSLRKRIQFNYKHKVLDFGCGWGRITQLLSLYFNPTKIHACDVMEQAIKVAKGNRVKACFDKIETWPPACYPDTSFDFIFSYSVFSHLSEDNSWAWIREFYRILKPGGIAFFTTRHKTHLEYLKSLRSNKEIPAFANGAAKSFLDIEQTKNRYDKGLFCFDHEGGGGDGLTPLYGEAFIPPQYVSERYGSLFSKAIYVDPIPEGLLDQATIILQK
jgi:2-polyprenyl-3-methyl-5-hydroxy-6-metoxy-1,4-benzoquinol methylase